MKMTELNLNPIGPTERISSAAIGANFNMVKEAVENLSAGDISQTSIAIPGIEKPSVEDALGSLNENLVNLDASQIAYSFPDSTE